MASSRRDARDEPTRPFGTGTEVFSANMARDLRRLSESLAVRSRNESPATHLSLTEMRQKSPDCRDLKTTRRDSPVGCLPFSGVGHSIGGAGAGEEKAWQFQRKAMYAS